MSKKSSLPIFLALSAACAVGATVAANKGALNLAIRNALAKDYVLPDPGWTGSTYENIKYSDISESCNLDIYVPESDHPMPLLILVHGGGFFFGDKHANQPKNMYNYFRRNGYACATLNYRMGGEAPFPAAIEDVKAAVRFLRSNAELYGYDPDRFAIWGESAGGYIAAMVALSRDDEFNGVKYIGEEEGKTASADVTALIDFYGVINMKKFREDFETAGIPKYLTDITNGKGSPDSMLDAFTQKKMAEISDEENEKYNPESRIDDRLKEKYFFAYIAHGNIDITVPIFQSARFAGLLKEKIGARRVVYAELENLRHGESRYFTDKNLTPVRAFLDRIFGIK